MPYTPNISTEYTCRWSTNRQGNPILCIIAHGTAGTDSRAYLARGGDAPDGSDRMVSIHVLIRKEGTIYRMLSDALGANHAGFGKWADPKTKRIYSQVSTNLNRVSLGFELENKQDGRDPYTVDQLRAMGWQLAEWRRLYGPLPIIRHADVDPSRRKDTVGLTVQEMGAWIDWAIGQREVDVWHLWGTRFPLPAEARSFGIPTLWKDNARWLGAARSGEVPVDEDTIIQAFDGGYILYSKQSGIAQVYKRFTVLRDVSL